MCRDLGGSCKTSQKLVRSLASRCQLVYMYSNTGWCGLIGTRASVLSREGGLIIG